MIVKWVKQLAKAQLIIIWLLETSRYRIYIYIYIYEYMNINVYR